VATVLETNGMQWQNASTCETRRDRNQPLESGNSELRRREAVESLARLGRVCAEAD